MKKISRDDAAVHNFLFGFFFPIWECTLFAKKGFSCKTNILWSSRTGVFFRHFQLPNPATPIRYHSKIVFVSIMFSLFIQIKPLGNNEEIGRLKHFKTNSLKIEDIRRKTFCFKTLRLRFSWWKLTILKTMLSASIRKKEADTKIMKGKLMTDLSKGEKYCWAFKCGRFS